MANAPFRCGLKGVVRQRSLWVALVLWLLLSLGGILFHREREAIYSSIALSVLVLETGLVALLTRQRPMPALAQRAPERALALRETFALWLHGVLVAGRLLGQHFFGEGIALHLNGSLVAATAS
jgi:hypothetical protein